MSKRKRIGDDDLEGVVKKIKPEVQDDRHYETVDITDRLSLLSDEILLRIFSFLSITELGTVALLSHRYATIADDSQLWRNAYYDRFVRPKASKLSILRDVDSIRSRADINRIIKARARKWPGEESLVRPGNTTDWKRQYKLRHNWAQGQCDQVTISIAEERPLPPLHVRFHDGIVYTADVESGLKAWEMKKQRRLVAHVQFPGSEPPTSLAIDMNVSKKEHRIVVGFRDGRFVIYSLSLTDYIMQQVYDHPPSSNGMLMAMAYCTPFLVTMTANQLLSVYKISRLENGVIKSPLLLHSLRSHTMWPPLAISLRPLADSCIVAITYVIPTIMNWAVGVQELHLDKNGEIQKSRVASSAYSGLAHGSRTAGSTTPMPFLAAAPAFSKPTSISYTHPYLLLSHPDNTLTLFLVTSNAETLSISDGTRLWGHTSAVSGAHVEGRGKAVSVSAKGEELRIWDLEGSPNRRWIVDGKRSVQVRAGLPTKEPDDSVRMRGWVDFDEESVVVLKERSIGRQELVVYDFT